VTRMLHCRDAVPFPEVLTVTEKEKFPETLGAADGMTP
jgi:hypothetical protein